MYTLKGEYIVHTSCAFVTVGLPGQDGEYAMNYLDKQSLLEKTSLEDGQGNGTENHPGDPRELLRNPYFLPRRALPGEPRGGGSRWGGDEVTGSRDGPIGL